MSALKVLPPDISKVREHDGIKEGVTYPVAEVTGRIVGALLNDPLNPRWQYMVMGEGGAWTWTGEFASQAAALEALETTLVVRSQVRG